MKLFGNDIPYQEGVLDILKGNSDINIVILSELLIGDYEIRDFLNIINKINPYLEIIFFMEKENSNLRTFLHSLGVTKIYVDNENSIDEIIMNISSNNFKKNLSFEIEELKKIIVDNHTNRCQNMFKSNTQVKNKNKIKLNKTIAITGSYGCGKSLFTVLLAKTCQKFKMKTIIIDFDIFNNSINTIFKISKYNKNYKILDSVNQFITKINNNIDIFCGVDKLFNENNKISFEKIKDLLDELKKKYDLILIDTSSEVNLKYTKIILSNSENVIFLLEPNLLEIKKAENLLDIYIKDWEIPDYKFIVLNKVNINSIDEFIIKNLFNKLNIIGKIGFSKQYTSFANNIDFNIINYKKYIEILKKLIKGEMKKWN